MTTTTEQPTAQQGACEVCERVTSRFDEWSGAYLCCPDCEEEYFASYADAVAGMLSEEAGEED